MWAQRPIRPIRSHSPPRSSQTSLRSAARWTRLQVASESGLAGMVSFTCTGLPVGMNCNFNPAQASIAAGSNISSSFTVTSTATQKAGVAGLRGIAAIVFPLTLISLWHIRGERETNCPLILLSSFGFFAVSPGGLLGCGGGSSSAPQSLQETGPKTIPVSANSGSIARTIPPVLNIQ
jgi:hypothetical protein